MNPSHKKYVSYAVWAQFIVFILAFLYIDKNYANTLTDIQTKIMIYTLSFDGFISAYLLEKYAPDPEAYHRRIIKFAPLVLIQFIVCVVVLVVWRWYLYPTAFHIQLMLSIFLIDMIFSSFYLVFFYKRAIKYITAIQAPPQEDIVEVHQSIQMARRIIFLLLLIPIVIVVIILYLFKVF